MSVITSIKNKLHIGREIPVGENSKTGEIGAKIDTEDKVSLSSGSDEEKNSMSLKDAATTGGVGFAIGLGVGNNGRIKNLENEMNTMKSGKKLSPPMTMEDGKEPPITRREMKAIKMISRRAFRKGFLSEDFACGALIAGMLSFLPALIFSSTVLMGVGIIGVGSLIGGSIGGGNKGKERAERARGTWIRSFRDQSEAESMVDLNREYPEIWMKMLKKG